jgi:hypothetical protein
MLRKSRRITMSQLVVLIRIAIVLLIAMSATAFGGRKNMNSLHWDPKEVATDSSTLGGIIPDGDVYISAVDSIELKLNGYHVTNAIKDNFYFGELRLPPGRHTLIVFSMKGQTTRNISAARGNVLIPGVAPSGTGVTAGTEGGSYAITKGGSGSKMLLLEIDIAPGEQYIIRAGKTINDWKVIRKMIGKKVDAKFTPVFE